MKRKITRIKGRRFCTLEIELEDRDGLKRLSLCGTAGRIVSRTAAKKEAFAYWRSFFEEDGAEFGRMVRKFGVRSINGAARKVVEVDGEFHGLDVDHENDRGVFLTESCGQIREELAEFFPEAIPFFAWHLNDMHAGCEHQEADGWDKRPIDPTKPLNAYGRHNGSTSTTWNMLVWVRPEEVPGGLLGVPCPVCGYKYGSAWTRRELPAEVIHWAETFGKSDAAS